MRSPSLDPHSFHYHGGASQLGVHPAGLPRLDTRTADARTPRGSNDAPRCEGTLSRHRRAMRENSRAASISSRANASSDDPFRGSSLSPPHPKARGEIRGGRVRVLSGRRLQLVLRAGCETHLPFLRSANKRADRRSDRFADLDDALGRAGHDLHGARCKNSRAARGTGCVDKQPSSSDRVCRCSRTRSRIPVCVSSGEERGGTTNGSRPTRQSATQPKRRAGQLDPCNHLNVAPQVCLPTLRVTHKLAAH